MAVKNRLKFEDAGYDENGEPQVRLVREFTVDLKGRSPKQIDADIAEMFDMMEDNDE